MIYIENKKRKLENIQKQYPNAKILKIELTDRKGYDVGLSNDVDVEFDKKFNVIDIDF